jgi:hypothetical protein
LSLWRRLLEWLRALLSPRLALSSGRWGANADALPDDIRDQLSALPARRGAVRDAVMSAIDDYVHLRQVLLGPGATGSPVDDVALLAEAEVTLRSVVGRASSVAALVSVAIRRRGDRAGREATGDAILHLRDQARALHEAASAAIQWAASRSRRDAERLQACAQRLHLATERAERAS